MLLGFFELIFIGGVTCLLIFDPCVRRNFQPRNTHGCGSHCRQFPWKTTLFIPRRVGIKCRVMDDIHGWLGARSEARSVSSSLCAQRYDRNYHRQTTQKHLFPAQDGRQTVAICFQLATIPLAGRHAGTRSPGRFAGSLHITNASPFPYGIKMIRRTRRRQKSMPNCSASRNVPFRLIADSNPHSESCFSGDVAIGEQLLSGSVSLKECWS